MLLLSPKRLMQVASVCAVAISVALPVSAQTKKLTPTTPPVAKDAVKVDNTIAYKISPEDVLQITVVDRPELSIALPVGQNGVIGYPLLGEVNVSGMTTAEVATRITKALSKEYVRPQVTVTLRERQIRFVNVFGNAVKSSGKFQMRDNWRVIDALAAAGGITTERPEWVTAILFQTQDGVSKNTVIDLAKLYTEGDPSQNLPLSPDDTLVVQPLDQSKIVVQVIGEVKAPGPVPVPRNGSVTTVLNAVGGSTDRAALSRAVIRRGEQSIPVDLRKVREDGTLENGTKLEPGDVLVVPENKLFFSVIGAVPQSGVMAYPDDRKIAVLEAFSRAGGRPQGADLKNVVLIRPKGQDLKDAEQTKINLEDMLKNGNLKEQVYMEPGDVLFVPESKRRGLQPNEILGVASGFLSNIGWLYSISR